MSKLNITLLNNNGSRKKSKGKWKSLKIDKNENINARSYEMQKNQIYKGNL